MRRFGSRFVRGLLREVCVGIQGSGARCYRGLVLHEFGTPLNVLSYEKTDQKDTLNSKEIRIQILAAPLNPSDINTIEGAYPLTPPETVSWTLPVVAGHEAVGRVIEAGTAVEGIRAGDHVVPIASHQGTWRQGGVFHADSWHKISADIPIPCAAMMSINPPTALSMIRDFVTLYPRDVIVQNGATSSMGRCVIQIAKAYGIRTVNIIRDRPGVYETVKSLKELGADVVDTENQIVSAFEESNLPLASLGLNCVGGRSASSLTKIMKKHSTLVTYGGMSKEPLYIPTSALVFKDITCRGFWWSGHATEQMGWKKKRQRIDDVADLILRGAMNFRSKAFKFGDYEAAFMQHGEKYTETKVLFVP